MVMNTENNEQVRLQQLREAPRTVFYYKPDLFMKDVDETSGRGI